MTETNDKWYANGVKYECTMCGKCCRATKETKDNLVLSLSREESRVIAKRIGVSQRDFLQKYTEQFETELALRWKLLPDGTYACHFLNTETNQCTIYDIAPYQCRSWPFWADAFTSK